MKVFRRAVRFTLRADMLALRNAAISDLSDIDNGRCGRVHTIAEQTTASRFVCFPVPAERFPHPTLKGESGLKPDFLAFVERKGWEGGHCLGQALRPYRRRSRESSHYMVVWQN